MLSAKRPGISSREDSSASERYLRGWLLLFSYEKLDLIKRDIRECQGISPEEGPISIKDYYNKRFIAGYLKQFIRKYNCYGDINPNTTPIRAKKENLLQKMHLNSPLRLTLRSGAGSSLLNPPQKDASPLKEQTYSGLRSPLLMTPMSKQLFANDSPSKQQLGAMLVKYNFIIPGGRVHRSCLTSTSRQTIQRSPQLQSQ